MNLKNKISLNIENIIVNYNENTIINNLSHKFYEGTINCIIGNNGTGKSTLLKAIIGQNKLKSGKISLYGVNISNLTVHERVKLGISYLSQTNNFFYNLKVSEHFELVSQNNLNKKLLEKHLPSILALKDEYAGNLSGGQQRILALSMLVLQDNKKIILLDEVFAGVHSELRKIIKDVIQNIFLNENSTIIMIEQNEDIINHFDGKIIDIETLKN